MLNLFSFADSHPLTVGIAGAVTGWTTALLYWLKVFGEVAGVLGVIFGSIAAFFSMLIVIRNFIRGTNNKKTKENG